MKLIESTADLVEFLGCSIPEKKSAFDSLISGLGITFLLDETTNAKVFKANSEKKVILVGQKGVERLWAHAYGYGSAFSATAWKHNNGGIPFDADGKAILEEASQLLTWSFRADIALKEDKTVSVADQPSGLPSPFDPSDDGTVLSLAQSLWCQALCFILFHELAHVQLGHRRQEGVANVEQEKDADREAARWLLEDTQGTKRRQLERRLGVATALIYLALTDVYLPGAHGEDYPPGYDRLFQTLSQYFFEHDAEESEQVWAYVSICLMLHIHNKDIPLDPTCLKGAWRQISDTLVNLLANRGAN
jgi:Peptidase U49